MNTLSLHDALPICVRSNAQPPELVGPGEHGHDRSEEHTSELQSLITNSYAVFCLKKKKTRRSRRRPPRRRGAATGPPRATQRRVFCPRPPLTRRRLRRRRAVFFF